MTLHDIQSSLDELKERHPGITEEMVGVLLAAGGWEKKSIEEAELLFRSQQSNSALPHHDETFLPPLEEKRIEAPEIPSTAPESLIPVSRAEEVEKSSIPDNLPLRPFETSPHVWPFSKYKDVFHADAVSNEPVASLEVPVPQAVGEVKTEVHIPAPEAQVDVMEVLREAQAPSVVEAEASSHAPEIVIEKAPLTKKDEVMIAFGAALLLSAILLILYMFNNERL